ncbi:MAG: dihydropteroate synthase [Muribaculaceae bacterium]|nr:dihydropteroate synthase [Muribaculaceae bacterium]
MHDFLIKELHNTEIEHELAEIGFDRSYTHRAKDKFRYKNFKIFNLSCAQANIIKQTALSVGADCGTHREVITGNIENSSCIIGGSIDELAKIAQKLEHQPFGLKILGSKLIQSCKNSDTVTKTKIMGILNITSDSFSDGGKYFKLENAIMQLHRLIDDGADIIDIGAESTRPGASPIEAEKQLDKLLPILKYIKENNIVTPISIDTRSAKVAGECLKAGANIINDVSGFDFDPQMLETISQNPTAKIIIQHSKGTPETMQDSPTYENLMDEIYKNLKNKVDIAISKGIKKENIIIDPGIGFGKTKNHNLEIIKRWRELKTIGCPVLIGLSRKSLLELNNASNEEKDIFSLALNSILINDGIDYIRVHNVKLHKQFQNILD